MWVRVGIPLAILVVALIIGSGVLSAKPQSPAQRAAAIEAVIRCPQCVDVSVAQSEESTAIAVRHEIERGVARGQSTAQIEQTLVSQYGATILLEPPNADGVPLIWLIPIVLGAVALLGVVALFWRRSRQFSILKGAHEESEAR
jgi:cytochrome c-type biogenesis protein CcmH/NrfF